MATFAYYKITTAAATIISAKEIGDPKSITLCNLDADGSDCTIDLYLQDDTLDDIYILHDVVIPGGSTLVLEHPEILYDSIAYGLAVLLTSVSATQLLDVKVAY
tara:strand:+ start:594 stop:905 length:312 start_codon:yes stop_codon:yes gene_type:complete